ncbi:MarR family transcriptional regulator [Clostridium carboxidivorans P7]|uniref:Transcriptional regulator, MarR family n=1 Tax=Clostridium carboxidivorans P7 TaxID=536227 RepID=C6PTG0_9CLOT|nr:MarR family transcriptional regulator [Clostridium carboxidivorans]AKN33733.1 MarR family transcriptional regulator [Clostridium carboxidivorans P7]EET87483.1 transcriptional regulator, MarR family [Clostridium carboxidivorans P7]EFG86668.1 transcriptional regulator, MarR family [Clostridium carboxidivorans P7]
MAKDEFREIHDLLFKTIGLFHSKFIRKFCTESPKHPELKKNHTAIIGFLYQYKVLTATELSRVLNIEKGSLTTLIDQLEGLGLVIRCSDANDRRKTLISLTDAGKKEMEDIMEISIHRMSEILGTADPNELTKFADNLKYAVEFMEKF